MLDYELVKQTIDASGLAEVIIETIVQYYDLQDLFVCDNA